MVLKNDCLLAQEVEDMPRAVAIFDVNDLQQNCAFVPCLAHVPSSLGRAAAFMSGAVSSKA